MALDFWKSATTRIKKILTIAAFFLLSLIITIAGVLTPLSPSEASDIKQELEQMRENISVQLIFGNNFMICLAMFIPVAGPVFGCYVLYSTGVVIAAESLSEGLPPLIVFLFLFAFPFTWLEFLAYSIAFAQSVWLTRRIIQHRGKRELVNTCILISICAVMLLIAAIIETALIAMLTQG
ncbi:MAG: stage II sporulation protein M [Candidatus Bathyarchaeia archaeon]|nr:stage II sporulation protein M [Candidatus Bathyarchaeota archaeon]MDI6904903.1 stage II sporulation protein M [Candidatus Bathyarchaeia archaeon]